MSRYGAVQLTFQCRFSHGLTVNSNYTYASILDNASITGESQGGFPPLRIRIRARSSSV